MMQSSIVKQKLSIHDALLDTKTKVILGVAAIGVLLLLSAAWSMGGSYYELLAYAQTPPAGLTISEIISQLNGTIIAISALISTAMGIVAGVVAWLRARWGDKVISNDTNEWLQWFFEQAKQTDQDVKDLFKQVMDKHAEIDTLFDVFKNLNPEAAKKVEEAAPELAKRLKEVDANVENWQKELDRIYEISPKADPVNA